MVTRSKIWRRPGRGSSGRTARPSISMADTADSLSRAGRNRLSWLVFRPTTHGSRFLLLLLVMGFAAHNTHNNLLYLLFSVGLATVVVSLIAGWLSLRCLALETGGVEDRYAGTVSRERFRLRNLAKWLVVFGVEVEESDFPGPWPKASLPRLEPGDNVGFVIEKTYPRRGIHDSHRMRLSTEYPFGLFRFVRRVRLERRVIVFPHIHRVDISFVFRDRLGEVPQRHKRGESEELRRIRNYTVGDGFRHIHWKATAKLGELMVREFASNQQKSFTVIFDSQAVSGESGRENFEILVSLVASVASHLSSHRLPYRLVSKDEVFTYGFSPEHLRGIMMYLAVAEPASEPKVDFRSCVRESLARSDVVLVVSSTPGGTWAPVTAAGLHFIEPRAVTAEGGAARAS